MSLYDLPSTLPFKTRVLRALTDALKDIAPSNGYISDLADFEADDGVTVSRVYRGRAWFGDSDPIPMVSILEGAHPADMVAEPPVNTATNEHDWELLIQGFVNDDPTNPTDPAYPLLADVRRRLAIEAKRTSDGMPSILGFGLRDGAKNSISKLHIGAGVVRPADDVSARAYFWLSIVIRVVDNAAYPYL